MTSAITCEDVSRSEFTEVLTSPRYHYMDNLRALAMILGIFFHAALAFSPNMQSFWITADPQTSIAMDFVAWFTHLFRMPLFFVVAGFFCLYLFEKRGMAGFLKNRAKRILLPFVIFLPIVIASYVGVVMYGIGNVENKSQILQLIAANANNPEAQQGPLTTTHLWFLLNLVWFYLVFALLQKTGFFESNLFKRLSDIRFIIWGLPMLMVPGFAVNSVPHPAPEQFYPQAWSFGVFGLFFVLGIMIYKNKELIEQATRWAPWMLFIAQVAYFYLYLNMPEPASLMEVMMAQQPEITPDHLLLALLESYIAVFMTLVCLVAGKKLLDVSNAVMRYIADASYWIYIIHIPVLFILQLMLVDTQMNVWSKFVWASFATFGIGLVSYTVLVRWTPIGWMLNGRK